MKPSLLTLSLTTGLLLIGCGGSSYNGDNNYQDPAANTASQLASSHRGAKYLISEDNDLSLYTFDKDTLGVSNCSDVQGANETESCIDRWPTYSTLDDSASGGDFGVATPHVDHSTYRKHPLYYWFKDFAKGDINGDNIGTVWHLVYPHADFDETLVGTKLSDNPRTQTYLTAGNNFALYTFDNDDVNVSNCYGDCAVIWPPFDANLETLGTLEWIDTSKFTRVQRNDGVAQVAYNGKPLYYFANDLVASDTKGDWVKGVWHLIELASSDTTNITLGNNGASDYTINAVSHADVATLNASDPVLYLRAGERYTFKVVDFNGHPLELRNSSGSVLLAMGTATGTFEATDAVNFSDDNAGTISFTLTQALADQLSAYRCKFHASMSGDIEIK
ncbi:MAG TPA: hypothetical protein ENK65_02715 [Helicobacteraceae bacterium]|nr:hypothetical protein [Helicobacteraceae bacterium]